MKLQDVASTISNGRSALWLWWKGSSCGGVRCSREASDECGTEWGPSDLRHVNCVQPHPMKSEVYIWRVDVS
jgi:hypothetical protein